MPSATTVLLFAAATLALVMTPGAGTIYLITQTVDRGREAGIASMLGVEAADLVHMTAAAVGVSALIAASDVAYDGIRYAGAAYLIGMGVHRLWFARQETPQTEAHTSRRRIFGQGLVVQLLNPKPALFFAAFMPQFLDPGTPVPQQLALLGAVYIGVALAGDFAYVMAAGAFGARLSRSARGRVIGRASGITYVVLGLLAAFAGARPAKALS